MNAGRSARSLARPTRLVVPTNQIVSAMPFWLDRRPWCRKHDSTGLTGQGHCTASAEAVCAAAPTPSRATPTVRGILFMERRPVLFVTDLKKGKDISVGISDL